LKSFLPRAILAAPREDAGHAAHCHSVDDFDAGLAQLKTQGVRFAGEPYETLGNRLVFFHDADGNLVHLIKRAKPMPRTGA